MGWTDRGVTQLGRAIVGVAAVAVTGWSAASYAVTDASPPRSPCSNTTSAGVVTQYSLKGRTAVTACIGGTHKADGSVTASSDRRKKQTYAIYQGRPKDTIPPGYVGVDNRNGLTVVGCDTGTYKPDAPDKWNQKPNSQNNNAQIAVGTDEFTAPTGPVGPGDPCSPFVPHTPPGKSCGSKPGKSPSTVLPTRATPLRVFSARRPGAAVTSKSGQIGIAGDFGGGQGASGYLQVTYDRSHAVPKANVATGGNSRGGGGTVAVGNDGKETDDPFTPRGSPVVVCQD